MYSVLKYLFLRSDCLPTEVSEQTESMTGGLPHSEIVGSKGIRPSPTLIAAYHVLHRLLSPRHSPNALIALDPIQKKTESVHPRLNSVEDALSCSALAGRARQLPCSES